MVLLKPLFWNSFVKWMDASVSDFPFLNGNELYDKWKVNRESLPPDFDRLLLSPQLNDDEQRRGDLFQAEDEAAMDGYAWAIPDERALRICAAFAPLVEMGAGAGYWARSLRERHEQQQNSSHDERSTTDIITAFDKNVNDHAKAAGIPGKPFTVIEKGGPELLANYPNATLLLIYPDDHEEQDETLLPLSVASLQHYQGDTVIHVGEWLGSTLTVSMEGQGTPDQPYPWGRSTSPEFQILLEAQFHKILQVELPNWGSVRNCLTVWKRTSTVVLEGDRYAYIPPEERLEMTMAAPSTRHLL